jgi:hypothetical protein
MDRDIQLALWEFIDGLPLVPGGVLVKTNSPKKRYHAWRRYRRLYTDAFQRCPVTPLAPEPPFMVLIGMPQREWDRRFSKSELAKSDPKAWIEWRNQTARKNDGKA